MKVKLHASYRCRMMLYTLFSLFLTACFDFVSVFIFWRIRVGYQKEMNGLFDRVSLIFAALLILSSVAVFILIFHLLTRRRMNYLEEITSVLERISEGDLSARVPVRYDDEFSVIADCINRMALDLELLKQADDENEKRKNNLITNVAHDLRTPLTSIIGYLDILNTRVLDEENRRKYTKIAWDKALRLQAMIEDLFSFTKLSYGQMPIRRERLDLVRLLRQQIDEFYPQFREQQLTCDFESEMPEAMIDADGSLIARAFENLLSNAVKYGRDGKVVRMLVKKKDDKVSVSVINYGIVIPSESIPFIFEKFYRVEGSRDTSFGGTGLGLSIAKAIIERHGGTISAQSSLEGTVFEVMLPLSQSAQ